jgi:hypothetical protein
MVLAACGTTPPPVVTFELDVTLAGTGTGSVVSDPAGIDTAASTFSAEFDEGTEVTLTATAGADSTFAGWSGDCTGATCTLTMDAAKSVTATFTEDAPPPPETETLTVVIVNGGAADGSVTSNPAGIDTGNLSADFEIGATVVLTADAASGGFFDWQGGDCDGLDTPTCTVTIDADEPAVTARFNDVTTVSVQVAVNEDDAEEFLGDANPTLPDYNPIYVEGFNYESGQDLELGYDPYWEVPQAVGVRFLVPAVPSGAKVLSTVLGFTAADNVDPAAVAGPPAGSAGTLNLTITGQAADDPARFRNSPDFTFNITSRTRTTASVAWSITETWTAGTVYESADVTSILEEIQARPGWLDGQAIVFILEPDETTSTEYRRAAAEPEADPADAASLTIAYVTEPAP